MKTELEKAIDMALSVSYRVSGRLQVFHQIVIERGSHVEGDGFAEGETYYQIHGINESSYQGEGMEKTLPAALRAFFLRYAKKAEEEMAMAQKQATQAQDAAKHASEHLELVRNLSKEIA